MHYIVEVIRQPADGALIERFIIRNRITGLSVSPIMRSKLEAEHWCETLNRAVQDDRLNAMCEAEGQTP